MSETVREIYCDRLYELFNKHHPGKYTRDYINVILEQNKDNEHECYVTHCNSLGEEPEPVVNQRTIAKLKIAQKDRKKQSKKKDKKKKKKKKKKRKKKKVKLEDLLSDDEHEVNPNNLRAANSLSVRRANEPRKSIIHMLRSGLIINNLADTTTKNKNKQKKDDNKDGARDLEAHNIQVVIRFRPINEKEKDIEHRLLFRTEFDMDDKDYDRFLVEREVLISSFSNKQELNELTVDDICLWLERIKLDQYKKRFRRRKVNGDWMQTFPQFNEKKPIEFDENNVIVFSKNNQSKKYEMDRVLLPHTTQNEAFEMLGKPVINNIINGYNCTIFAFGQTGTGKTHTMFGYVEKKEESVNDDNDDVDEYEIVLNVHKKKAEYLINAEIDGLIPRILHELINKLKSDDDIAFFSIQCGFIEIYQEKLRDLIRPRLKIQLRYVGLGSELINLSWHEVNHYADIAHLITISKENRKTAATLQNDTSSRSHCIIQLKIEITLRDGTNQVNKMSFGDLAGSEKLTKTGAIGQRMNEAKKIVKSLFAIKKVIRALSEKKAFVPYQDSVLTKLLRDSLGGNSLTMIVCTASIHAYNREETVSTLRFAEMAKKIKNEAVVNRMVSRTEMESQINNLREQLQYLRKQKANTRKRFTSTDFRVLQHQLTDAQQKAEEYTQKYLQAEIQLLIKTQYIQELEQILNSKNIQIQKLKENFRLLKEEKININQIDINEDDMIGNQDDDEDDDDDDDDNDDDDDAYQADADD